MPKNVQILKQEQGQTLSPQQVQFVRMLELTNIELEQRIERELEDNPALEEDYTQDLTSEENDSSESNNDDWDLDDYASEDDIPAYRLKQIHEKQTKREEIPFAASAPSMEEELLKQLTIEGLSEEEELYARYIIGNIDDEGYLRRSPMELQDDLLFKAGQDVSLEVLESLIQRIKSLDPAGIGAKDLQECLILQLERKKPSKQRDLALAILREHYGDFVEKRFERLQTAYKLNEDELSEVYRTITNLSPRPMAGQGGNEAMIAQQLTPDFLVQYVDDDFVISLLGAREVQPLRLSKTYLEMLEDKELSKGERKSEARNFIKHKVEQARWFIDALRQRQNTLIQTMTAIVQHQKAFFLSGDLATLKPMILKDIAEAIGMDISTISRVSNSKNVQTSHGVYPLKYFFGEGITNDEGESISTKQIKKTLEALIKEEDKRKPLSDDALAKALAEAGYPIARRTVAKYREELQLPVARRRKKI